MTLSPRVLAGLGGWEDLWSSGTHLWWSADGGRVLVRDAVTGDVVAATPGAERWFGELPAS